MDVVAVSPPPLEPGDDVRDERVDVVLVVAAPTHRRASERQFLHLIGREIVSHGAEPNNDVVRPITF